MQDKIIFYFIIYSFLGWCLESVYKTIIFKKITNSGFLYGPFCPMYGIGAVMLIAASSISDNIFVIFLLSFLLFTLWEYIVAVVLEKLFKTKYWDYSHLKFNFQGRICLKNSIYWGILGVLLVFVIQPVIERITNAIPENVLFYINIAICLIILVDAIVTIVKKMVIDKKIRKLFEIGDTIKEKIAELKSEINTEKLTELKFGINSDKLTELKSIIHSKKVTNSKEKADTSGAKEEKHYTENLNKVISDLKLKQDLLKIKIYKRIIKLRKAFPEMTSENIAKFMTQKIELKDVKDKIKKYKESNKSDKKN